MDQRSAPDAVLNAYAQTLIKYKAKQLSRKSGFRSSEEEDLVQELTMALIEKSHLFDPTRGAASTFADRVIRTAIAMLIRDRRRLKRAAGFTAQSLEQPTSCDADTASLRDSLPATGSSAPQMVEGNDFISAVRSAVQLLPPDLKEIATRLKINPISAVARDMGISRRQLGNAIERIRKHFESKGLNDS